MSATPRSYRTSLWGKDYFFWGVLERGGLLYAASEGMALGLGIEGYGLSHMKRVGAALSTSGSNFRGSDRLGSIGQLKLARTDNMRVS